MPPDFSPFLSLTCPFFLYVHYSVCLYTCQSPFFLLRVPNTCGGTERCSLLGSSSPVRSTTILFSQHICKTTQIFSLKIASFSNPWEKHRKEMKNFKCDLNCPQPGNTHFMILRERLNFKSGNLRSGGAAAGILAAPQRQRISESCMLGCALCQGESRLLHSS